MTNGLAERGELYNQNGVTTMSTRDTDTTPLGLLLGYRMILAEVQMSRTPLKLVHQDIEKIVQNSLERQKATHDKGSKDHVKFRTVSSIASTYSQTCSRLSFQQSIPV